MSNVDLPKKLSNREEKGRRIATNPNVQIKRIDDGHYQVNSQSRDIIHDVISTEFGWICSCEDHQFRKADCKHIKIILEIIKKNQCYRNNTFRILERSQLKLCKYCDSGIILYDHLKLKHNFMLFQDR